MDLSGHEEDIPIPIPMSNSYVVHGTSNRPPPTISNNNHNTEEESVGVSNSKKIVGASKLVKYRECLKNHAASMGGNATDGCGEFMPSGEEGTLEALKCSACSCHRNFHRKEVEGEPLDYSHHHHHFKGGRNAYGYLPRGGGGGAPALIMPLGAMQQSESDEMEEGYGIGGRMAPVGIRKRFRTKFTQEQKEKMLVFADKVGWRLQRQEEGIVQHFCQEIGVKRRVLKVWMHNNKHHLSKKNIPTTTTLQLQCRPRERKTDNVSDLVH